MLTAAITARLTTEDDRHRHGRQRRDRGAGRDHRSSGYVELWAAPIIGAVAGVIVVLASSRSTRCIDDPVGALSAHGLAGVWGTLSCGFFTAPAWPSTTGSATRRAACSTRARFEQLSDQALGFVIVFSFVLLSSLATSGAIKMIYGLRVTDEEEDAGLDISEHGMYGYPEQFIPNAEYPGGGAGWGPAPACASGSGP